MEEEKVTSPLKAIKLKCLDCSGLVREERDNCSCTDCPLHPFRFGKNPYSSRTYTEEQRQAASERFRKLREGNKLEGES